MYRRDMRWLKLLALLAALTLSFAACGEEEPTTTPGGGDNGDATEPAADFTVLNEGRLSVGSDYPYPPFEFEEAGALTGFDVEIIMEVASRLGLENDDTDWQSVDFGTIFQQLASNTKFDIVAAAVTGYAPEGSPASETVAERAEVIDFTVPYYPSLQSLTVNTTETPDIMSVDTLPDGAKVGVQRATTGAFYAEEKITNVEIVGFEKAPQMYQQLEAGGLDAVFNDLPISLDAIANRPDLDVVEQVETGEEYAFAVSKDNPALTEAVNAVLEEMFADGTYATIFKKYFPEQTLPSYASE